MERTNPPNNNNAGNDFGSTHVWPSQLVYILIHVLPLANGFSKGAHGEHVDSIGPLQAKHHLARMSG